MIDLTKIVAAAILKQASPRRGTRHCVLHVWAKGEDHCMLALLLISANALDIQQPAKAARNYSTVKTHHVAGIFVGVHRSTAP